jgi:hypothetical protein
MEDRCFQSFKDAMKLDAPFETFLTTLSPRPRIDSKPLTTDISSLAKFHNEAPHISTAKVTVIDAGIGIWNGAKRAFALIGLEQMEVSGQERIEILDTMTATDQASRDAFKEKLLSYNSSELHPVSISRNYTHLFISREINDAMVTLNNPRLQGAMQALGGVSEASVGARLLLPPFTPLGAALVLHGADHFVAGTRSMIAGSPIPTASELLLQRMGMTPEKAAFINNLASIYGVFKGINSIRDFTYQVDRLLAQRAMNSPQSITSVELAFETADNTIWILPKKGGGAFINDRWYTEHALERMAPRTPAVMAELEARALKRTAAEGLQPGTEEFGRWMSRNGPDPRGIPPFVIEIEIANPSSTNIRVILNQKGEVITVIPGGK